MVPPLQEEQKQAWLQEMRKWYHTEDEWGALLKQTTAQAKLDSYILQGTKIRQMVLGHKPSPNATVSGTSQEPFMSSKIAPSSISPHLGPHKPPLPWFAWHVEAQIYHLVTHFSPTVVIGTPRGQGTEWEELQQIL